MTYNFLSFFVSVVSTSNFWTSAISTIRELSPNASRENNGAHSCTQTAQLRIAWNFAAAALRWICGSCLDLALPCLFSLLETKHLFPNFLFAPLPFQVLLMYWWTWVYILWTAILNHSLLLLHPLGDVVAWIIRLLRFNLDCFPLVTFDLNSAFD